MNPKKIHETSKLAAFIIEKSQQSQISHIIDLGAGQGYLSHLLVTTANLNVTAIEAKSSNLESSLKRVSRINKGLNTSKDLKTICDVITHDNFSFITDQPCILIGLHTCGDLASTSLKLFATQDNIRGIINVGCCYQHLTEYINNENIKTEYLNRVGESANGRSLDESLTNNGKAAGFPLSEFIKQRFPDFFLGKLSRSLCISQPSQRHIKKATKNFKKMEFRAGFQSFLSNFFPKYENTFALGNKINKFEDFADYVTLALCKMGLSTTLSKEELNNYYEINFKNLEKKASIL